MIGAAAIVLQAAGPVAVTVGAAVVAEAKSARTKAEITIFMSRASMMR